jgi:hypothetical protein
MSTQAARNRIEMEACREERAGFVRSTRHAEGMVGDGEDWAWEFGSYAKVLC